MLWDTEFDRDDPDYQDYLAEQADLHKPWQNISDPIWGDDEYRDVDINET